MSNQPDLTSYQHRYLEWLIAAGFLWVVYFVVFSPLTASLGWFLERRKTFGRIQLILLAASLLWVVILSQILIVQDFFSLKHWLLSLPLFPIASEMTRAVHAMSHFLKPKTLQEYVEEEERKNQARSQRLLRQAEDRDETNTPIGWLKLGAKVKGDLLSDQLGMAYEKGWLLLQEPILDQHLFLLGATGAGKSETIKRLVQEVLANTKRDIFFVDGKGDEQLANDIRSLAHKHNRGQAPVFRLGFDSYGAIYNGFRGNAEAIDNRLRALIGITEVEGNAQYYADINRTVLSYICRVPQGPPRTFEEVLERIDKRWLERTYRDDPLSLGVIQGLEKKDLQSLRYRVIPLMQDFRPCIGDEGFSLEESPCAIFSVRVQSVGDTSRRFLDFLVEDLKDFVGNRQRRPAVLVIDEFGQFSNNNIISLLTLARSSNMGVILATQDVATLEDWQTQQIVLANTRTKILMGSDFPEAIAQLAGTAYQIESSFAHEDGEMTGAGSARVQHTYKIDMNEAGKLKAGEAFIIRQRHTVKIKVQQIKEIEQIPAQEEEKRLMTTAAKPKPKARRKRRGLRGFGKENTG